MPRPEQKIIYIHIPKTGGSSLHNILNRQYGKKHSFQVKNNRELHLFDALSEKEKNEIDILKGHMAFGHHVLFPDPEKVSYFTLMRDPVKRIISNYYFILKRGGQYHAYQKLVENNCSLKDYVESGVIANAENAQIRLLSDNIGTPHGECQPFMVDKAKANIEKYFSVVGVNEYYDETLLLLQDYYQWKTPYYSRVNVTGHGVKVSDLDKDTLSAITKFNALDIELYEWAKARLEQEIHSKGDAFKERLIKFKKKNAATTAHPDFNASRRRTKAN
jgi:hypothetical protein